ncbi:MAG TPA: hypothetical protein VFC18_09220, partial [Burkholderiales bacterium]|nr:hypothetical protein [Burkholderiales bacterium]
VPRREQSSTKQRVLDANRTWLEERWDLARSEKAGGKLEHFAMAALKADGRTDIDDPYQVAEKLLEMKPNLARSKGASR